jgi:hypothetical protein
MLVSSPFPCPLCHSEKAFHFYQDQFRDYYRCERCSLVFVLPSAYLSPADEKSRYDLHKNSPDDPAYRLFLSRLFNPLQQRLPPNQHGLDFGAGPGPTLSVMFTEAGHHMEIYDPFYAHEPAVLTKVYDFITTSEVVEHLHHPAVEFERLWRCIKPSGYLGIMTKLVLDQTAFAAWHYKNDPTHVCFYSESTFHWLAAKWQADLTFSGNDVILLQKI